MATLFPSIRHDTFHLAWRTNVGQYRYYYDSTTTYEGSGDKITFTEGLVQVRKRVVIGTPNVLYIDITTTTTGFSGIENADWEWIVKVNLPNSGLPLAIFRDGSRGGTFRRDAVLNATGFAGVEDTDWEQLSSYPGGGVQTTFRDGVRSAAYVIDKALTATGFGGSENTDWENIIERKIP